MKSKFLSLVLRHKPEAANLSLDKHGWVKVDKLLSNLNLTKKELDLIVETNNKKRFEYNDDETKIRACQGHSVEVDIEFEKWIPTHSLFHGTIKTAVDIILLSGIKPMTRQYVHLSSDLETAMNVGSRHGLPIILEIDAVSMHNDGLEIVVSKNGVYLTKYIPAQYIKLGADALR